MSCSKGLNITNKYLRSHEIILWSSCTPSRPWNLLACSLLGLLLFADLVSWRTSLFSSQYFFNISFALPRSSAVTTEKIIFLDSVISDSFNVKFPKVPLGAMQEEGQWLVDFLSCNKSWATWAMKHEIHHDISWKLVSWSHMTDCQCLEHFEWAKIPVHELLTAFR